MGSRLTLTISIADAGRATWEFVGSGYGHDAAMAMFTVADCIEDVYDPDGERSRLVYETTARVAVDRLACYGFGFRASMHAAEAGLDEPTNYPGLHPRLESGETLQVLVDAWIAAMIDPSHRSDISERGNEILLKLMDGLFEPGSVFPMLHGLSLALDGLPPSTLVQADLSDSDWVAEREDGEVFLRDFVPLELISLTPASVLCEGVFDSRVIEHAIKKTHPHLTDHLLVARFDFNREGSSSALTRLVRGLADVAATGPRGLDDAPRIIAVFDADRAGVLEANRLAAAGLPSNFTVLTLPERPELRTYPVLTPTGVEPHDVNSWGAAIETYLAIELDVMAPLVLSYDHGAAGGYQGALERDGKAAVQRAFEEAVLVRDQWPILESIVQHIVHASSR